jgi:hypothetical protein
VTLLSLPQFHAALGMIPHLGFSGPEPCSPSKDFTLLHNEDTKGWILEGLVVLALLHILEYEHPSFRSETQFGVIIKLICENLHSHSLDEIMMLTFATASSSSSSSSHFHTCG